VIADVRSGQLTTATLHTLQVLLLGMLFGATAGFILSSFAVFSRFGHDLLTVLSAVLNPLPSIAILPLAMIWFGLRPESIVFVVALATIWPVAINTDTGFRTISNTTQMAARKKDAGERADVECGMAKLFATETCFECVTEAMRIHGGYGFSKEYQVERLYRDAPLLMIGEGTNEIQKLIIARGLLERHKIA